jgi:hypothetical protein
MQNFLSGLATLVVVLTLLQVFAGTALAQRAAKMRTTLGWAAVIGGGILLLRGQIAGAMGFLGFGAWALMQRPGALSGLGLPWMIFAGRGERQMTPHLDVFVVPDTGRMRGKILTGFFAGRRVESLKPVELVHLLSDCQVADAASAHMIARHLDHAHPGWRDHAAGGKASSSSPLSGAAMTPTQALDILGLQPGADEAEIRCAHKELMLKLHPDRGGSHTLATTVNAAKDLLLAQGRI